MNAPVRLPYARFSTLRSGRDVPAIFQHLWCCGNADGLARLTVAVVGTRAATSYGKVQARRFAAELSAAGCCIVSGLALGIDAAAHRGALDAGGPTIGVLGSGHERFFPSRNRALAQEMLDRGGAVLSPYPPEHPALPWQFLERNAIVAALSDAVLVIEAPARSGALNTAGAAAGRIPVYAVPGDVDRAHVAGCHALIRDGAILARSAQDILDDMRIPPLFTVAQGPRAHVAAVEDPLQRRIIGALGGGERSVDELVTITGEATARVLSALSVLELKNAVDSLPGARYVLR